MKTFKVMQVVNCDLNVWYSVKAENVADAMKKVKQETTPTCVDGADYEIVSDRFVLTTAIEEASHA